jgi:ABC-type Zn uptake system ZnuABC Zn-binding protein ZnuA
MKHPCPQRIWMLLALWIGAVAGCTSPLLPAATPREVPDMAQSTQPNPAPVLLADGQKLRVVATTSLVGDVVGQVGGETIELTQLLPIGADPHSYQARPDDLRALNNAHVVFANGLHLEEAMQDLLDNLDPQISLVEVNTGVTALEFHPPGEEESKTNAESDHAESDHAGHDHAESDHAESDHAESDHAESDHAESDHAGHDHAGFDPHTWMDVRNVMRWTETISTTLAALDPAHADVYAANAARYQAQLEELQAEIVAAVAQIPAERRNLVSDHRNLGYLAHAYGFTVAGTVVPSFSTLASPSAQELARLQTQIAAEKIRAIFVDTTVNPAVAAQLAADTGVAVVPIYTHSLSDPSGPAATYLDMMRYTVGQIVAALAD